MRTMLGAVVAVFIGQPALPNEGTITVAQMAQMCRALETYCDAYMDGVQMMMQANCQLGGPDELSIGWFPSLEAGRSAFLLWSANNPDQLNVPAFHGVVSSFRDAFPCN